MTTPKTPNEKLIEKYSKEVNNSMYAIPTEYIREKFERLLKEGIEKGKQMQKKEELEFLERVYNNLTNNNSYFDMYPAIEERIEELKIK